MQTLVFIWVGTKCYMFNFYTLEANYWAIIQFHNGANYKYCWPTHSFEHAVLCILTPPPPPADAAHVTHDDDDDGVVIQAGTQ